MIRLDLEKRSISRKCRLLGLQRSAHYYRPLEAYGQSGMDREYHLHPHATMILYLVAMIDWVSRVVLS